MKTTGNFFNQVYLPGVADNLQFIITLFRIEQQKQYVHPQQGVDIVMTLLSQYIPQVHYVIIYYQHIIYNIIFKDDHLHQTI